jgi:putative endopeptidase
MRAVNGVVVRETTLSVTARALVSAMAALLCAASATAQGVSPPVPSPAVTPVNAPATAVGASPAPAALRAQDDLYLYVNRAWELATPIPPDKASIGAFDGLRDISRDRVKVIIDELAAKPQAPGSDEQKIADYYRAYTDDAAIDARGLKPVQPLFALVDAAKTPADFAVLTGRLAGEGVGGPLSAFVGQDAKNATRYLASVNQSGLSLPDREYYLGDSEAYQKARAALVVYITTVLRESGAKPEVAASQAAAIVALETKIAAVHRTRVQLRDPNANYNLKAEADWSAVAELPWRAMFNAIGSGGANITEANIRQPEVVGAIAGLFQSESPEAWRAYFRYRIINSYAEVLPKSIRTARFELYGRTLRGLQQEEPRWRQATDAVGAGRGGALGEAVGRLYVERHFPPEAKARMVALVANLQEAYHQGIDGLTWMTPATKAQAQKKLSTFRVKIGYPDVWRDYSAFEVKADDPVGNAQRSNRFELDRNLGKLGKPIDRSEWGMTPQTVNAYYSATMNEIVFPAAILQPPFFDMAADDATNYGGIGAVIGHEISHGFDDSGSQFDADGNLKNWWTADDRKAFEGLTARVVAQYDGYQPLPGKNIQGKLTLGENLADVSGLAVSYRAYRLSLGGKEAPVVNGITGDQRFFLGWAQVWRSQYRDAALLQQLTTDPHSPGRFRAIGSPVNMDAFHQAFGTQPGDGMWKAPDDRIRIW